MIAPSNTARPLEGVVILDLLEGQLAPLCRFYADLGAEVVQVRLPGRREASHPRERLAQAIGDLGKAIAEAI